MRVLFVAVSVACAACASEYHPEYHPVSSYTVNQNVSYPTIYQMGASPPVAPYPPVVSKEGKPLARDPSQVLVVESSRVERPAEVIGVVDVQAATSSHEAGLVLLRQRAAEMGADAVVGVEFHHGDTETHISGLAVHFLQTAPGPR